MNCWIAGMLTGSVVLLITVLVGVVLYAPESRAGGLYVGEYATPSTGTANAGAEALGRDASAALHNPASMTRLEEHELMVGIAPGFGSIEFDPNSGTPEGGNDGGNQASFLPLFSSSYVHALTDRARLGLAAYSISGASLDPRGGFAGRNQLTELNLLTLSAMPSLAVEITDWLSVGGGPILLYARLDWDLQPGLPTPPGGEARLRLEELDDFVVTGLFGVMVEPSDTLRFSLIYQDEADLELGGEVETGSALLTGTSVDLELPLARRFSFSSYWQATEELALLFTFGWEDWSTLDTTAISIGSTGQSVALGFQDTIKVGGGFEYRVREDLLLQTGVTYDSSALKNKDRTVALPIDRQIRFGIGAIWDYSDSTEVAVNFQFADLGNSKVRQPVVTGNYSRNQLFFFGVMLNWKDLPWKDWGKL
jgi:long-chain fatty acid transport protein